MPRLTVLVSGMLAGVPGQGGATWAVLQYLLGLRRLGHAVYAVEPVAGEAWGPAGSGLERSASAAYFHHLVEGFGLAGQAALLEAGTQRTAGMTYQALRAAGRRADVLLNVAGMLRDEELTGAIPIRVYLDLDPAFTQLWQVAQGIDMRLGGHTHFVTVGSAIGQPDCPVPTAGVDWLTTLPPVVLEQWPVATGLRYDALTTVANWRGYGSIDYRGVLYGQKAHSLRGLVGLPRRASKPFALALAIHPAEEKDLAALRANGWQLVDPAAVAGTPAAYRDFVEGSWAEFGVAKSGYVLSRCGWFSDRSACYLASGRPVIAQDTGFGRVLPVGRGLFAFAGEDDILAAVNEVQADYAGHAQAARALAEEHLDSDRVLRGLLRLVGAVG